MIRVDLYISFPANEDLSKSPQEILRDYYFLVIPRVGEFFIIDHKERSLTIRFDVCEHHPVAGPIAPSRLTNVNYDSPRIKIWGTAVRTTVDLIEDFIEEASNNIQ